jgi:hypothetical protein
MTQDEQPPVLRELAEDEDGPYWQEWRCAQPPAGVTFVVKRSEWYGGVRVIHEVEIIAAD